MNFNQTISKLYSSTEKITVYAAQAYDYINGDHVPSIGIRSYFAGYQNNDPIIDGVPFMVCGDVYLSNGKRINEIHDLVDMWTYNASYVVMLRAVVGFPTVTVDLGRYEIVGKREMDEKGNVTLELIRFK